MILDERNEFVSDADIPAAGSAVVGDVIDLRGLGGEDAGVGNLRDLGNGQPVYWYATAGADVAGGTSINFQLITSDNADMSGAVVLAQSGAVALADMQENPLAVMMSLPLEGPAYQRYLGLQADVAGTFSAGSLSSGLTLDPHGWRAYPEGDG